MKIEEIYQLYLNSNNVSTDTRTIEPNDIYFALKGDNFDGNKFCKQALEKGAKYCIVDSKEALLNDHCILVSNTLNTLQKLATHHRITLNIPIVALTGSNGKTTTKELINEVLSQEYQTSATKGNLNNHIGVPLTLLKMTSATEIGIVEMGANHANEIAFLCNIALPDYGVITNFGKAHLEGFGSIEGVIKAKSELYNHLKENNKTIFINTDDAVQLNQTKGYNNIVTFNSETISFLECQPYVSVSYQNTKIDSKLTGKYNYTNIAIAIAIGNHFKVPLNNIKQAIEGYTPSNNRSQLITKGDNTILLDAYNANPTSMKAALENFHQIKHENKILFLGDMFELGKDSDFEHQAITSYLDINSFAEVFLTGKNFHNTSHTNKSINTFDSFESLKVFLETKKFNNAYILIKGSRGMALERIIDLI
ncbi:UDP-N-acetylmuramoyl-tripeptide--D-alanyl-D-alanine ligase [Corallibacter sp.]|uniref:UDP-N-acetylmuramoyl-tripeptide--D-alanyl-D- alanine ligase n=1 Tax=Corallibacter sp. TaxID=2038084 RepID=UPI003AB23546